MQLIALFFKSLISVINCIVFLELNQSNLIVSIDLIFVRVCTICRKDKFGAFAEPVDPKEV